jgi:hypothetical protein
VIHFQRAMKEQQTHLDENSRFVVDDEKKQPSLSLVIQTASPPAVHEDVRASIGESRISGFWLAFLGVVMLAALAKVFVLLHQVPLDTPAFGSHGVPVFFVFLFGMLVLSVGGMAAFLEGWNRIASAKVWANRVSWLYSRVPARQMLVRQTAATLQRCECHGPARRNQNQESALVVTSREERWFAVYQ